VTHENASGYYPGQVAPSTTDRTFKCAVTNNYEC